MLGRAARWKDARNGANCLNAAVQLWIAAAWCHALAARAKGGSGLALRSVVCWRVSGRVSSCASCELTALGGVSLCSCNYVSQRWEALNRS